MFETTEDGAGKYDGPGSAAFAHVTGTKRWRWPADKRDSGASLHAKLPIIDGRQALIGSANLTHRALTANLEAVVLLRDPDVAASLEEHVRELMRTKVPVPAADQSSSESCSDARANGSSRALFGRPPRMRSRVPSRTSFAT